jgi:intraflagellar transport protein 80
VATICDSFQWHDKFDVLTSVADGKLATFFYPNVMFIDPDLLSSTTTYKEVPELGRSPQIVTFC